MTDEIILKDGKEIRVKKSKSVAKSTNGFFISTENNPEEIESREKNSSEDFDLYASQKVINMIFNQSSVHMNAISDNVASLIFCSPPYNVNKDYSTYLDSKTFEEYIEFTNSVWKECYRILRIGGRLVINVAGIGRRPYISIPSIIQENITKLSFGEGHKFLPRGWIIWNKGSSAGISTAWGSFKSPSNPVLRDVHEFLLVFSKDQLQLSKAKSSENPDITNEEFVSYSKSIWNINAKSDKNHPAVFPIELAKRVIKFYTYPGDLVADPFCGIGTTCIASKLLRRIYMGYDIDPNYVKIAKEKVRNIASLDLLI